MWGSETWLDSNVRLLEPYVEMEFALDKVLIHRHKFII